MNLECRWTLDKQNEQMMNTTGTDGHQMDRKRTDEMNRWKRYEKMNIRWTNEHKINMRWTWTLSWTDEKMNIRGTTDNH